MRGQNRKVIQAVMKSPSPDIAHRSIIANTRSPANEIKEYIKMRENSTSPKSMNASSHQISKGNQSQIQEIQKLKKYIQDLQSRIQFLQRIKSSHDQLAIINQSLNSQISQLRVQIRRQRQRDLSSNSRNISPSNSRAPSPKSHGVKGVSLVKNTSTNAPPQVLPTPQPNQNDSILREFNERIVKMSEENKRLVKKLKQTNEQKDSLLRQNSSLRNNQPMQVLHQSYPPSRLEIESLKKYFEEEADNMSKYYQKLNEEKIYHLKARISQVQTQLAKYTPKKVPRKPYTRTNTPQQMKANISIDTNFRSQNQDEGPSSLPGNRYNMVESKYTTSPGEFRAFTLETSPIRVLQEEKQKMKRQNDFLKQKASELQKDLRSALLDNDSLQKRLRQIQQQRTPEPQSKRSLSQSNFSHYKSTQQRNELLEADIAKKNAQIKVKDIKIQQLERNFEQVKRYNEKKSRDLQKNIDQQKQKSSKYHADIQHYIQQINFFQQSFLPKQKYELLERELDEIKSHYNKYRTDFEKYLEMVLEIRYSITGEGVDKCLREVELKWQGYDELEVQIIKIHECYRALIQNLKKKVLEKEVRIVELEKQNRIVSQESYQTRLQLEKLERAITEYRQPVRTSMNEDELKIRMTRHQTQVKTKQKCQMRDYISRTVTKISSLESEIEEAITSHSHKKPSKKTSNIKYFEDPAEADNMYRRSQGSVIKRYQNEDEQNYEHGQNYEGEQDPSLIEDENIEIPHK